MSDEPLPLEKLDIEHTRLEMPRTVLECLFRKRQLNTAWQFARVHAEQHKFSRWRLFWKNTPKGLAKALSAAVSPRPLLAPVLHEMYQPVNPILLCTAIALLRVGQSIDISLEVIKQYVNGLRVQGLESNILLFHKDIPHDIVAKALTVERDLVQAMEDIGLDTVIEHGPQMTNIVGPAIPSMWDVRKAAWCRVNVIAVGGNREKFWNNYAIPYGLKHDNILHGARESFEEELRLTTDELNNNLAKRGVNIKSLATKHKIISLHIKRMHLIYEWMPHEIDACAAEMDFVNLLRSAGVDTEGSALLPNDQSKNEWHSRIIRHQLPPEALAKIRAKGMGEKDEGSSGSSY